jgi:hypothetical protein
MTSRYSIQSLRSGEKDAGKVLRTFLRSIVAPGEGVPQPGGSVEPVPQRIDGDQGGLSHEKSL